MQLKNDDDVNTMLVCYHQFSCVGPIELLCTIGRTPDGILNLLEATMTPTHDTLLYYNGRWNMSRTHEFVGYSFIGKNPKKFDIPSLCTIDEIPPYGIHESQTVRRLFFREPSHYEYSDKVIKFEIIELKTNDDVLKVSVQSNYWKQFGPIEILVVMEMEDNLCAEWATALPENDNVYSTATPLVVKDSGLNPGCKDEIDSTLEYFVFVFGPKMMMHYVSLRKYYFAQSVTHQYTSNKTDVVLLTFDVWQAIFLEHPWSSLFLEEDTWSSYQGLYSPLLSQAINRIEAPPRTLSIRMGHTDHQSVCSSRSSSSPATEINHNPPYTPHQRTCGEGEGVLRWSAAANEMDKDEWMYEIMSKQADMDYENEEACGANEPHVDCSDAFNTSQVFECREDVLWWARSVAHENGFVAVILRSDTNTGSRGRTTFVLIGCERSGEYKCRKKEFIRRDTGTRKCGCPFKLRCKPVVGGEGWMVKLICGVHNHEFLDPYARRLTKAEKTLIADMKKSMVKPRNILLTLKEHNANSCTTIKQIYNARSAFHSSIRGSDLEMQHLMKLLEHSTYKTNRYRLSLLDFVGVTPTGMTFFAGFAYVEGECVNNLRDALPGVIVIDKDQALMNTVKVVFPDCTNLLCSFYINKNGCLTDCPSEQQFDECLKKFEMACIPWPMFVDYFKETWIIPHKEKFVSAWTNKVMQLGNTTTNRYETVQLFLLTVESAHSSLKRPLQNSLGDLCSVRLLGMVSRYALNQIAAELECVDYAGKNPSSCGYMVRTMLGLPCACELSKYVSGCIPLDSIHMFWRRLSFSDQGLFEPEVSIKEVMETISKRFEELDVCGKFTLKTKLWEIAYPDQNSMCPPPAKVNTKGAPKKVMSRIPRSTKHDPSYWETMMPMLDQFHPFMHDFIDKIVDVKADGNCGYRSVVGLLGMGQDFWPVVRNHLLKELVKFSEDYIKLFGGTKRFEELRMSLLVDGLTKVTTDKWMDITDMKHVIASRYNANSSLHRIICIGHVYGNHFFEVYLKECCPLPLVALLWSSNCHLQVKSWPNSYISIMQHYKSFVIGVSFQASTPVPIQVPNGCDFQTLKTIIHNTLKLTDKQFLDEIYYRQPFTYAGNEFRFRCMQLKDDVDVNTMLMCNHEFSFVDPIELLCSIARTPDGILNLLQATMTPTHDALLYYNGR
ncbi:hypothetical protein HKD37_12G034518 [Glycine soja]